MRWMLNRGGGGVLNREWRLNKEGGSTEEAQHTGGLVDMRWSLI